MLNGHEGGFVVGGEQRTAEFTADRDPEEQF
jgi:hypothetical protein